MIMASVVPGCGADMRPTAATAASAAAPVKAGQWGGPHISMTVSSSGAEIEFDCGKATVATVIDADRDGAFSVSGDFQPERPGPTTPNGPPKRPMRVSGTVKENDMQVSIVLTDRNEEIGTFTLTFGTVPRLTKCR